MKKKAPLIDLIEIERKKLNDLVEEAISEGKPLNGKKILREDKKMQKIIIEFMKNI